MVSNWIHRHPRLVDAVMLLALALFYVVAGKKLHRSADGLPIAVVEILPLLVRRRFPLAVLAVVTAAALVEVAVYGSAILPFAAAFAVYTAAANLDRRTSLIASATSGAALLLFALARGGYGAFLDIALPFGVAWVVGDSLGTRRAYLSELELRAEWLEREQQAEAARAVAEEQARIARELHDVIAHSVSVMVVHAAAGRAAFDQRPQRACEALETIESTGRSALGELRRLLGAVRDGDPNYEPQPGLSRLASLIDQVRGSGLEVVLEVEGSPIPLPAALELSAYRVVQEALTNTLKHAQASHVDVHLHYRANQLEIEVRDNGTGKGNAAGGGSGLIGMRERVAAVGGTLSTGVAPSGGYLVKASVPL
jgi:signal transduction histidine kinase